MSITAVESGQWSEKVSKQDVSQKASEDVIFECDEKVEKDVLEKKVEEELIPISNTNITTQATKKKLCCHKLVRNRTVYFGTYATIKILIMVLVVVLEPVGQRSASSAARGTRCIDSRPDCNETMCADKDIALYNCTATCELCPVGSALSNSRDTEDGYYDDFLDCPGNKPSWWQQTVRVCCEHETLPNNCECFDVHPLYSKFTNSVYLTPYCPDDIRGKFILFNRNEQPHYGTEISADNLSSLKPGLKTYLILHGWGQDSTYPWVRGLKDELMKRGISNVVLVEYGHARGQNIYHISVANSRVVAAMTGRLLQAIVSHGIQPQDIHMIGHSLGAQTAGLAGQEFKRLTGEIIGRISALDPAGPRFNDFLNLVVLDKSDANFIDVIHTDAQGWGFTKTTGHADFWPNGGRLQPGCRFHVNWSNYLRKRYLSNRNLLSEITGELGCNHRMSTSLFWNSTNGPCQFLSTNEHLENCRLGFHAQPNCRGDFYLNTTKDPPYCDNAPASRKRHLPLPFLHLTGQRRTTYTSRRHLGDTRNKISTTAGHNVSVMT